MSDCCQSSCCSTTARVGQPAPDFTMKTTADLEGLTSTASLSDYAGKWLVLFFYPLDFTFVCPTEITGISDRLAEFKALNAEVLGVSTDSVFSHRAWIRTPRSENGIEGLQYPLAADMTQSVARNYGVLLENDGIALRGLFIVDPQGVLQYATIHNLNVGRNVDETLRVLEGLQTGGRCPLNWRKGDSLL